MAIRQFSFRWRILIAGGVVLLSLLFVFSAVAALRVDTTMSDFNSGQVGSCFVGPSAADGVDGEVTLSPTLAADFSGGVLPTGWATQNWLGGGSVTFSGGAMFVNGAVAYGPEVSASSSIEFMALVPNALYQGAGFSNLTTVDFAAPWAFFGSFGIPHLYARTSATGTDVDLGSSYFGTAQRYRIDWPTTGVTYFINDAEADTRTATIVSMRPLMSDYIGAGLTVYWLRMGPYSPSTCTYTSTVVDSGIATPTWTNLLVNSYVPAYTTLSFETRAGSVPDTADSSWSAWQAASGGIIASPTRRYLQYRAVLATTDSLATPRIYSVQPQGTTPTAIQLSNISGQSTSTIFSMPASLLLAFAAGLAVIGLGHRVVRANRLHR
jgi:hypothetical protein